MVTQVAIQTVTITSRMSVALRRTTIQSVYICFLECTVWVRFVFRDWLIDVYPSIKVAWFAIQFVLYSPYITTSSSIFPEVLSMSEYQPASFSPSVTLFSYPICLSRVESDLSHAVLFSEPLVTDSWTSESFQSGNCHRVLEYQWQRASPTLPTTRLLEILFSGLPVDLLQTSSCLRWIQECSVCFTSPPRRSPAFAQTLPLLFLRLGLTVLVGSYSVVHNPTRENLQVAPNHHNAFTAGLKIVTCSCTKTWDQGYESKRQESRNGTCLCGLLSLAYRTN